LIYENNANELIDKNKKIVNYMDSLFKQNKIEELIIFFDILLEGLSGNILNISKIKIIDEETINKLNNILLDISYLTKEDKIINYRNYEEMIFILLNFDYKYNKKHIFI
jgi:hypothetical protein